MDKQTKFAIIAIIIVIPLVSYFVWASDQNNEFQVSASESEKIKVLTSFYPLYEFTKEIGKDRVEVSVLVPSGVEPHDWTPTIKDIQTMQQADLIIINGFGFEQWAEDLDVINRYIRVVDTSFGISPIRINPDFTEEDGLNFDPHIWLNPKTIKIQVQNIVTNLKEIDPTNGDYYSENAQEYLEKIDFVDKQIREELSACPNRDFLAFHNAFGYFAKEYGLNQHTVLKSIDPFEDPSARDIQEVISLAQELGIKIIFTEEFVNPKMSQVIANELGGEVLVLSPLEIEEEGKTFLERLEENKDNLKRALCAQPRSLK